MGKAQRDKERRVLAWLPDYDISEDGEIRRITPSKNNSNVPRALKGWLDRDGYTRVYLRPLIGKHRNIGVHRLVCEAFHGAPPTPSHEVAHWDGCRANNTSANVRWATTKENASDRLRHGNQNCFLGALNPQSKITESDVIAIRADTRPQKEIAADYGITFSNVSAIKLRKSWAHV